MHTDTATQKREDELLAIAAIIERDRKRGFLYTPEFVAFALVISPLSISETVQVHQLLGDSI